jgi:thioredoxin 1
MKVFDRIKRNLTTITLMAGCLILISSCSGADPSTVPANQIFSTDKPTLAEFGRGTCIPCKEMQPILEELSQQYKNRMVVLSLNVDDYRDLTNQFKIMAIPTQIILDKDGKELFRHIGFWSKNEIIAQLDKLGIK